MSGGVLHWTGRVLAADDVRRRLNGHRAVLVSRQTILTPLAWEELRGRDVSVTVEDPPAGATTAWAVGRDRPYAAVQSAVQSLGRDGLRLRDLPACENGACDWAVEIARCVEAGRCCGGVVFCEDPSLVCCLANKAGGVRAAAVATVPQAARATLSLGANLLAVEMPGRTYFEVRQILRLACGGPPACPPAVAAAVREASRESR